MPHCTTFGHRYNARTGESSVENPYTAEYGTDAEYREGYQSDSYGGEQYGADGDVWEEYFDEEAGVPVSDSYLSELSLRCDCAPYSGVGKGEREREREREGERRRFMKGSDQDLISLLARFLIFHQ